jgi:MarR family transcriptional regulator, organic hydroperoxide resistance regulator
MKKIYIVGYLNDHYNTNVMSDPNYRREDSIGFLTHVAGNQFVLGLVRAFHEQGYQLTHDMWLVLNVLWDEDGLSQQTIADRLYKDKSSLTRLLHTMEQKGHIERVAGAVDKRRKRIHLTEAGKALQKPLRRCALDLLRQASKDIGVREWVSCLETLKKITDNLVKG